MKGSFWTFEAEKAASNRLHGDHNARASPES